MITLYTKADCQQCDATKRVLVKRGVPFEERDLADPASLEVVQGWGMAAAPVVDVAFEEYQDRFSGFRPDRLRALTQFYGQNQASLKNNDETPSRADGDMDISPRADYAEGDGLVFEDSGQAAFDFEGLFGITIERKSRGGSSKESREASRGRAGKAGRAGRGDLAERSVSGGLRAGRDVSGDDSKPAARSSAGAGVRDGGLERDAGGRGSRRRVGGVESPAAGVSAGVPTVDGAVRELGESVPSRRVRRGPADLGEATDLLAGAPASGSRGAGSVGAERAGARGARRDGTGGIGSAVRTDRRGVESVGDDRAGQDGHGPVGDVGVDYAGAGAEGERVAESRVDLDERQRDGVLGEPPAAGLSRRVPLDASHADTEVGMAVAGEEPERSVLRDHSGRRAAAAGGLGDARGQLRRVRPDSPSGERARVEANLAALRALETGGGEVAGWSGWGGLSRLFDESVAEFSAERSQLRELVGDDGYKAARRGVLNAHYTHGAYVSAIWDALEQAGVDRGEGLEPGCGAGTFISHAPAGVRMTGVELDPSTAAVAAALNPDDVVLAEGFEKTRLPAMFDVAVGNVPFSDVRLHDRAHNQGNHSLHNHFIIKSLDLVKPGGYVALITSSFTMDAKNPAARRDMYERADLVGAFRLPGGAHRQMAGTDVVSDVLVFRKRADGETPGDDSWTMSSTQQLPDRNGEMVDVALNDYWAAHPDNVLGEVSAGTGAFGQNTVTVRGTAGDELAVKLGERLSDVLEQTPLRYDPIDVEVEGPVVELDDAVGTIRKTETGGERLDASGQWEPIKLAKTHVAEFHQLLDVLQAAKELVAMESTDRTNSPELEVLRDRARQAYEDYAQRYGPINRNTKKPYMKKSKLEDGTVVEEESVRLVYPPATRALRSDPRSAVAFGLEKYDDDTGVGKPADILSSRQIYAPYKVKGAESIEDALALSVEQKGGIDVEYVAYLLGRSDDVTADLLASERVFQDVHGDLVIAEEYLSGNVRAKLEEVEELLDVRPDLARNAQALRQALPPDIEMSEIAVEIGAAWIPASDYQQFAHDVISSKVKVLQKGPSEYSVTSGGSTGSFNQTVAFGTKRILASTILKKLLEGRPVEVTDTIDDKGTKEVNPQETAAAREKAELLQAEFKRWIWADAQRADRLHAEYQRRFNAYVPRSYDAAGSHLRLPGFAASITLADHQKAAIARMVAEPTVGLFHEVGAGKTFAMVAGVMEQQRLGLVQKPLIVVPNHLLGQFENEWLQAYPAANLLSADITRVNTPARRAEFFAQATASRWDAIIVSESAFGKLSVSDATAVEFMQQEVEKFEGALAYAREAGDKLSVAEIEKKKLKLEQDVEKKLNAIKRSSDSSALTFEQLGIDYLVVDEAHAYKNLAVAAGGRTADLGSSGSNRATDMAMKIDWLRRNVSERCVTMATATPVANSMAEMFVMMRYLRPSVLADAGVDSFPAWVAQFARKEQTVEIKSTGKPTVMERFTTFQNVPELLRLWHAFADVKLAADLDLPVPLIAQREDGQRRAVTHEVELGPIMREFQERLDHRDAAIRQKMVSPREDNPLVLADDGTTFALDDRLFNDERAQRALGDLDTSWIEERKIDVVARQVLKVYEETKDNVYFDEDGQEEATRGAMQIVFCDRGVPKKNSQFSVYEELRNLLIDGGVPAEKIAFIHDAKNKVEKTMMFQKARTGAISVLIGSTEKMGTGANMQDRAVALHHVDAPWRPADLTQRNGRIVRRGNKNAEVQIFRYVTRKSLDAWRWQTLERKARFISQVMTGRFTGREVEDVSEQQLDYAESKAIATADPLLMRSVELRNEVSKLTAAQAGWESQQRYLKSRAEVMARRGQSLVMVSQSLQLAVDDMKPMESFACRMEEGPRGYFTERAEAARALGEWISAQHLPIEAWRSSMGFYGPDPWLQIGGVSLAITYVPQAPGRDACAIITPRRVKIEHLPVSIRPPEFGDVPYVRVPIDELRSPTHHTIMKCENLVARLPERLGKINEEIEQLKGELTLMKAELEKSSPHERKLAEAKDELKQINRELNARDRTGIDAHQERMSLS